MKDKIIILSGMPGAGKGEMSKLLMKDYPHLKHLSTGNLFRSLDKNSEIAKKISKIQESGKLVDDEIVNEIVEQYVVHGEDLLFDGYPRSIPQAEWLLKTEKDFEIIAILLEIDETVAVSRRDKRINQSRLKGIELRKDDLDPTVLPKRFEEYYEKTAPMLEFLRERLRDNFYSIDASVTIDGVYSSIKKILNF
jgi:adenylate kinase